ncbi:uncharacterized protein J3R85_015292 [Psidium guajava]|nr:uncharacterized protein J3R85_015292 [Psidium guajava]
MFGWLQPLQGLLTAKIRHTTPSKRVDKELLQFDLQIALEIGRFAADWEVRLVKDD